MASVAERPGQMPRSLTPDERAALLLRSYLSEHQRMTYLRHGFFYVMARDGQVYALSDGWLVVSVDRVTGTPRNGWHVGSLVDMTGHGARIPQADSLLAQLLMLEASPAYVLQIACNPGCGAPRGPLGTGQYLRGFLAEQRRRDRGRASFRPPLPDEIVAPRPTPAPTPTPTPPAAPTAGRTRRWPRVGRLFGR